jgi:hypothetical protein
MTQCRCADPNKRLHWGVCPTCEGKATALEEHNAPSPPELDALVTEVEAAWAEWMDTPYQFPSERVVQAMSDLGTYVRSKRKKEAAGG